MKSVKQWSKDGLDSLKTIKQDKAEYKAFLERVKKLPKDYRIVYEEITKFLWQFSSGDGMDMVDLNQDLLEFFEESAAAGIPVLELIGGDVGAFAENTLHEYQAKTWIDSQKTKMNQRVAKKLEP
ncbi:cytoplasmic protein [Enterococcus rivorum]|uniref:Cytoplasmic protein n=2 Tax=Enterococcus rivorum TaxID=762845 RepID=A0A1E5KY44_9ENTE|nr:cytoplasmic protein [Enterococcus rivorum]